MQAILVLTTTQSVSPVNLAIFQFMARTYVQLVRTERTHQIVAVEIAQFVLRENRITFLAERSATRVRLGNILWEM